MEGSEGPPAPPGPSEPGASPPVEDALLGFLVEQQRLGRLDKQMEAGTPVVVEGYGEGKVVSYKATWVGANLYTIHFASRDGAEEGGAGATETITLKDKVWNVAGVEQGEAGGRVSRGSASSVTSTTVVDGDGRGSRTTDAAAGGGAGELHCTHGPLPPRFSACCPRTVILTDLSPPHCSGVAVLTGMSGAEEAAGSTGDHGWSQQQQLVTALQARVAALESQVCADKRLVPPPAANS